jgi:hypothetical protein
MFGAAAASIAAAPKLFFIIKKWVAACPELLR